MAIRVWISGTVLASLICAVVPGFAKPPLPSSEATPATACLQWTANSYEDQLEFCDIALGANDLSTSERLDLIVTKGDVLSELLRMDEAEVAYNEVLALDGFNAEALEGLGWVWRDRNDHAQAAEFFQKSLTIRPSAQNLGGLADTQFATGEINAEQAIEYLSAALAISPRFSWAIRAEGWIRYEVNDFEGAQEAFLQALEIEEWDHNAQYGLARSYFRQGKHDAALDAINGAIEIDPDHLDGYLRRSIILRALGWNAQALRDADRILEADPSYTTAYVARARALTNLGKRGVAIRFLQETANNHDQSPYFIYHLSDLLGEDEQYLAALVNLERNLSGGGADAFDWELKAWLSLALDDYPATIEAAHIALATRESLDWARYYLAIALIETKQKERGLAEFDRAMVNGLDRDMIGDFARTLVGKGFFVEAIALRTKY
jgi:tetratricopeptide (TPR) repeat protein